MLRVRRVVIGVLATVFLALPAVAVFRQQGLSGDAAFLVPGTAVFIVLVDRWVLVRVPVPAHRPLRDEVVLWVIVVLGVALFVVGQMSWLTSLAIAAAGAGRFAASLPRAVIGVAACAAAGVAVGVWYDLGYGATLAAFGVPLLGGLLAYSAERRNVLMVKLNQARAELARTAVARGAAADLPRPARPARPQPVGDRAQERAGRPDDRIGPAAGGERDLRAGGGRPSLARRGAAGGDRLPAAEPGGRARRRAPDAGLGRHRLPGGRTRVVRPATGGGCPAGVDGPGGQRPTSCGTPAPGLRGSPSRLPVPAPAPS